MSEVKKGLLYAKSHEWVMLQQDGAATVGLSDHAQDAMGDIVFLNLPSVGDTFSAGDVFGDLESVKAVSDIYCPVSGTVTAINEELLDSPEKINQDPYGSWLVKLNNVAASDELLDDAAYEELLAKEV